VPPNKDFADLFAARGEEARKALEDLKSRAVDGLELAIEAIPDEPSQRRRLRYVRKNIIPLLLKEREEEQGLAALMEATKDSRVLAALDDVAAATKLKPAVLKAAVEEEAQRRVIEASNAARAEKEAKVTADAVPEEVYAPLLKPGVLERYVEAVARMHGIVGDRNPLRLITLVAVGAQLAQLPNGKPLGASGMLIAEAGRGKNYLTDAVVAPLPPDWYLSFESASASSLYYRVERNPAFLEHRFVYPNEIEAVDALVEFLRPMLSSGKAIKLTVNRDTEGRNEGQELEVRGPITTIIPTVRNKTDEQLQTRLLVAELEDYEGRVKEHTGALSRLLLPGYAATDNTGDVQKWQAALGSLTSTRRVVFPLEREEFALDNDGVPHGARLWANLLGLMCAHAWLEQRNRAVIGLEAGEQAVVAAPEDYKAAYSIFEATSRRTVVNLSKTHRKILDALCELRDENPDSEGFTQREIAERAEVKQSTVSKQRTFLVTSAKLIRETEYGLALVKGAEPSWWSNVEAMRGFPSPDEVGRWWREEHPPSERSGPDEKREGSDPRNQRNRWNHRNRDIAAIAESEITRNGSNKGTGGSDRGVIPVIPDIPEVYANVRDNDLSSPVASYCSWLEEGREEKSDALLEEVSNLFAQNADATGGEVEGSG
jgi:hypothetical protein